MSVGTIAETATGSLAGASTEHGLEFLGVPYATAARFAAPERPASWSGVREATRPGPAAPQPPWPVGTFTHGELPPTAEQCLNLNLFTPSLEGTRPVLVWIHGGAFTVGHSAATVYRAARLAAAADMVVVIANYRLGSLGWLSHRGLAARSGAACANWGLLDQIAALAWVREHAGAFGGDAGRVTVAGQSAGGLSAWLLLAAPAATGLFQRAILQSPPLSDAWQSLEEGERWATALSELAGSERFDAGRLRAMPAEQIVELHDALLARAPFLGTRGGALPTLEPATLPGSPAEHPGVSPGVPVLIGTTADEGTFFFAAPWSSPSAPDRLTSLAGRLLGIEDPAEALEGYARLAAAHGREGDLGVLVELATDAMFARPATVWSEARARAGAAPVYRYRVDHPGASSGLGATHCVDVPLLFGTYDDGGPGQRLGGAAPGAAQVSAALRSAWARFVHGDDPGWEALDPDAGRRPVGVFGGAAPFSLARGA